jgi:hypothetical protein
MGGTKFPPEGVMGGLCPPTPKKNLNTYLHLAFLPLKDTKTPRHQDDNVFQVDAGVYVRKRETPR